MKTLTWEEEDEHLQVEVERAPGGGLMLRHGRDDGNVILGVARVEQRVETTSPRRDFYTASVKANSYGFKSSYKQKCYNL